MRRRETRGRRKRSLKRIKLLLAATPTSRRLRKSSRSRGRRRKFPIRNFSLL
jgi:hypothetical protein